jgi:protein O-mannosyl-transferase
VVPIFAAFQTCRHYFPGRAFFHRFFSLRMAAEKLAFIFFAALFLWITVIAQSSTGATDVKENFPLVRRILFGFYGIMMYSFKFIVPVNQSTFYPFPAVNVKLSFVYYLGPAITLLLLLTAYFSFQKTRIIAFGLLFYFINLFLVLQFYIVGSAVLADRYTYVPYIGLSFITAWAVNNLFERFSSHKTMIFALISFIVILFTGLAFARSAIWKDDLSLWLDAIKTTPSSLAYSNLGREYKKRGDEVKAISAYTSAIKINKADATAHLNLGNLYFYRGQLDSVMVNYNQYLLQKPDDSKALVNRAVCFAKKNDFIKAYADYRKAEAKDSSYDQIYSNRGLSYYQSGSFKEAIADFRHYLKFNKNDAEIINTIGVCFQGLNDHYRAIKEFDSAIQIKENAVFYINRTTSYYNLNKYYEARSDISKAKSLGAKVNPAFENALERSK